MLIRFSVANFRSLRERQELSLATTSLKDDEAGLIPTNVVPSGNVCSSAIIYGANASGKSNFVSALVFMERAVLHSHRQGRPDEPLPIEPFALDASTKSEPTVFDADFIVDATRYHYGFEATREAFIGEWLYAFPAGRRQLLFERTGATEFSFGRGLKGRNRVIADLVRPNSLFLSAALQNGHKELTRIATLFRRMRFSNSISVQGPTISSRFESIDVDDRTINFLREVGTGVVGFRRIDEEMTEDQLKIRRDIMKVIFSHINSASGLDIPAPIDRSTKIELAHQGADGSNVFFDPDDESAGTRRLLLLASSIFRALDDGALTIIDELDASLHTQACEAIVALFTSKDTNPRGAQLIATTHDTNLMRSPFLRRDQIWFAEKDPMGATHIFPLSDIQTRRGDNIEKGYLQGRFGAIPFSGPVDGLLARI